MYFEIKKNAQVNTQTSYRLFSHVNCMMEKEMAVKHSVGFITKYYLFYHVSFSSFSKNAGDFKTYFFYEHSITYFQEEHD